MILVTEIEISDEEVKQLEKKAKIINMEGEVCPYPQIIAREQIQKIENDIIIIETDHVMATKAVPQSVFEYISKYSVWKSGSGQYKIVLWKK